MGSMGSNASGRDRRFLATAAAAEAWRRWRAASRALPEGTWKRYWTVAGPAFVLLLGASVGLARLGATWGGDRLDDWDRTMLARFVENAPIGFSTGVLLESGGNLFFLVPLTLFAALVAAWRGLALTAVGALAAYWLCRPLIFAGWLTWDRARPDLVAGGIAAPSAHSFPSGHAALAAASFGYLFWLWADRSRSRAEQVLAMALCVILVVAVSAGRLRLGTHWPSDVIAGLALGGVWVGAIVFAEIRARRTGSAEGLGG